jgi:hypothetical protein
MLRGNNFLFPATDYYQTNPSEQKYKPEGLTNQYLPTESYRPAKIERSMSNIAHLHYRKRNFTSRISTPGKGTPNFGKARPFLRSNTGEFIPGR